MDFFFKIALLTVETMEVSRKIRRDARVRLSSIKVNLTPVTGSLLSAFNGFSVLISRSVEGSCVVSMAVRSEVGDSECEDSAT